MDGKPPDGGPQGLWFACADHPPPASALDGGQPEGFPESDVEMMPDRLRLLITRRDQRQIHRRRLETDDRAEIQDGTEHVGRFAAPSQMDLEVHGIDDAVVIPIGGIVWVALGAQDTSCYVPFYAGATDIPKSFAAGDHFVLDRASARWAFDYVDFHTQVAYNAAIEDVKAARKKWEDGALDRIAEIDALAGDLYKRNPREAAKYVTGFSLNNAQSVVDAWWKLGDDLWVKYNHLALYDGEKRRSGRIPTANREWWNKAVRAFDVLSEPEK